MPPSPTCSPAATAICLPEFPPGDVTASLDWATADHAVAVVNNKGTITEQFLVDATGAGLRELVRRLRRACRVPELGRGCDQRFQAAGSYWLISPPGTGRRRILP
jgi:hypothetical protein